MKSGYVCVYVSQDVVDQNLVLFFLLQAVVFGVFLLLGGKKTLECFSLFCYVCCIYLFVPVACAKMLNVVR